uniref:Ig-like domain-containing protein n=1 Tax=Flavobacteriaceae TaxID=49546 RepID=UPI0014913825|nr:MULTISPECIES: Ig-like domain-containing protein [Allomuricauda]MDC6366062.1 Ig-like domain-containing protein [Muricauda sp. AC10]
MKRVMQKLFVYCALAVTFLGGCTEENHTDSPVEIQLNKSVLGILIGETYALSVTSEMESNIQWSSNKADIATVNSKGLVTGISEGTAIITSKSEGSRAICTVVISKKTYDLELNQNNLRLYPYPEYAQTLEVLTDVDDNEIIWESTDPSIATVDQMGNVTPLVIGETTITAKFDEFSVECFVEVVEGPVTLIELDKTELVMKTFKENQIFIENIESELEEIGLPIWESSDPDIVSVNNEGQLTSHGLEGTVTISVTVDNLTAEATVTVTPAIVYVAGYDNDRAALWKNNDITYVTDGSESESEAEFVYVLDEENIYTTGHIGVFGERSVKLWNDDQELYEFTDGTEDARGKAILLHNDEIYAVGFEDSDSGGLLRKIASIWKNGNLAPEYELTDGTKDAVAYSFFVDSEVFYVSGYEKETTNTSSSLIPKVWMRNNDVNEEIVLPNQGDDGIAYSIAELNGDIYAVGYDRQGGTLTSILWRKNDNEANFNATVLSDGGSSIAYSIAIHNGNLYIAGYEIIDGDRIATIWDENGTIIYNLNSEGVDEARAHAVYVTDNGDVYAAGYQENAEGKEVATVWKNGEPHLTLSDGNNDARGLSIVVK